MWSGWMVDVSNYDVITTSNVEGFEGMMKVEDFLADGVLG
jgi:hypothetical protein